MNREIKFRAWDKKGKVWIKEDITIAFDGVIRILSLNRLTELIKVTDVDIEFYTGLKDKNGKEIYALDIMNFETDKSCPSGGYYAGTCGFHPENARVVEWDEDRWMVGSFRLSTRLRMYEVIGNVHNNPELLEVKK